MRNLRNQRGQTLVELAFLFPMMLFAFLIFAQLLRVMITQVWIHQSSGQLAYRVATGVGATAALDLELAADYLHLRKSAYPDPFSSKVTRDEPLQGWKSYSGVGTFDQPPHMVQTTIVFRLFRNSWYSWIIPGLRVSAQAECPEDVNIEQGS